MDKSMCASELMGLRMESGDGFTQRVKPSKRKTIRVLSSGSRDGKESN